MKRTGPKIRLERVSLTSSSSSSPPWSLAWWSSPPSSVNTHFIWNNTNIMCLNKCQQNYGNYLELLATLQKHCQRSQFVVPRGNSPLHTIYYYYLHHFAMCTTPSTSTSFNLQIFQQLTTYIFDNWHSHEMQLITFYFDKNISAKNQEFLSFCFKIIL